MTRVSVTKEVWRSGVFRTGRRYAGSATWTDGEGRTDGDGEGFGFGSGFGVGEHGGVRVAAVDQLGGVKPAERSVDGRQEVEDADEGEDGDGGAAGVAAVGA
ncbi:hypothetical protein, partial [Streptomyces sp. col6]|uniref:hypothetical protein n=1 Tax=Streptomyces sp. col6 TaxID=2478958 RepID=UPI001CD14332